MINLELEKKSNLTPEDVRDICDFAIQDAEVNGFVSSYDFEHAIWVYAAIVIFQENKDDIVAKVTTEGYYAAYQMLLEDGTLEKLATDYAKEMQQVADVSAAWYDDYTKFSNSVRAVFNDFKNYSSGILQQNAEQLLSAQSNEDFKEVYNIAEKWGLNNDKAPLMEDESLFIN